MKREGECGPGDATLNIATFTHYTGLYGANRSLLALIDGSRSHNVSFHVLAPREGAITEELRCRGISYHVAPFKYWMSTSKSVRSALSRLRMNVTSVPSIVSKLKEWDIDLLHTNSSVTPIGAICAEVLQCPHVWHIREFGDLDYNLSLDWGPWVSGFLMSRSNALVAVSNAVGSHVCGKLNLPYQVVYNGVSPDHTLTEPELEFRQRKALVYSPFTFAIVGLLHEAKGQREAIRAVHRLKESGRSVRLLIAGSGRDMENLKRLTEELRIKQEVSFLGFVDDPFVVYRKADAALMCSPSEAMGRVTAEAMIAGCPVIGYDKHGTKEIIDHRENGLLYNGTVEDLACKMEELMDNPEKTCKIVKRAFEEARSTYTNEVYADQMRKVFDQVLIQD